MLRIFTFLIFLLISGSTVAQQATPAWAKETQEEKDKRLAPWKNDRFGMFIHWGIYASPARHEWIKNYERISDKDYQKYFDVFDPDLYKPEEWAKMAKAAGMKYMVITTKHHDGFCLWDTKYTDFKSTNTPCKRDLIKPVVEAFRKEGIKVGFYYSLIDWHHPDFVFDGMHPNAPKDSDERNKLNAERDMKKYQQYMKDQLTELLTEFGPINQLFLDFSYGEKGSKEWDAENLLKHVRKLQPNIIVNDRLGLNDTDWGWDFATPEQFMPNEWVKVRGKNVPWETCQTFSGSWGYHRDEYSWKSVHQLIVMLIETTSKGGNLLLNVGPTARGVFDERANSSLEGIGKWMYFHNRSIYGCTQAPDQFEAPKNCLLTYEPVKKRLYIHVLEWPFKSLYVKNLKGKFKYAQLLNDGSEVKYYAPQKSGSHMTELGEENDIIFSLPVQKPNVEVPVIELFLE